MKEALKFILAYRFRLGSSDPFPHDAYPIDTAWTGPTKGPKLVRKWRRTEQGCLASAWHKVGPNSSI
jgi:hypothetical protein